MLPHKWRGWRSQAHSGNHFINRWLSANRSNPNPAAPPVGQSRSAKFPVPPLALHREVCARREYHELRQREGAFDWVTQNDYEFHRRVVIPDSRQSRPPIKINRAILARDTTGARRSKHFIERLIRDVAAGKQFVVVEKMQLFLNRKGNARMAL